MPITKLADLFAVVQPNWRTRGACHGPIPSQQSVMLLLRQYSSAPKGEVPDIVRLPAHGAKGLYFPPMAAEPRRRGKDAPADGSKPFLRSWGYSRGS